MGNFQSIPGAKKRSFLNRYVECGRITEAARLVEMDWSTHYNWLKTDPEYKIAFLEAKELVIDRMEDELQRRAVEGYEEPVYQGKELVGSIRKFSDTLLIFGLKANRPLKYRDRLDVTSNGETIKSYGGLDVDRV